MTEETDAVAVYQQLLQPSAAGTRLPVRALRASHPQSALRPCATGVNRLDDLLGGGLPASSATLLYGPPFTGKGVLERQFFLTGLRNSEPSLYILTDASSADLADRLATMDPNVGQHARRGLAHYVDAYSRMIGDDEDFPATLFLDDLRRTDKINRLVDQIDNQLRVEGSGLRRVVVQSLSTIIMEAGSAETFRFLRTLVGRVARRGGTVLAGLEAGMHTEPDVQAVKHLCNGMIQTREQDDKFYLRVEGLQTQWHPGWVEYEFAPERFELTGSFSSERIRGTALAG